MKKKKSKILSKISQFFSKNARFAACFYFAFTIFLGVLLTYYLIPILLNYGPGTINSSFDRDFSSGITYLMQYTLIYLALTAIGITFILLETKDFNKVDLLKHQAKTDKDAQKRLDKIVAKCLTLPQYIFAIIVILPTIIMSLVFRYLKFTSFADVKVILIIFTISTLTASLAYIFLRGAFKSILIHLNNMKKTSKLSFNLTATLMFQTSSLVLVCLFYTFLLIYSNNMEDKSHLLKEHYSYEVYSLIETDSPNSLKELEDMLNDMELMSSNDAVFIIDENNKFLNFNNTEVSDFFIKYALELSDKYDNYVYDYYGTENQGIVIPVDVGGTSLKVVIRYDLSNKYLTNALANIFIILIYAGISVYFFSNSVSKEISLVAKNMREIAHGNSSELSNRLAVTSNDEIGDLVIAFNEIQELTKQYINTIQNNQQILLEQERLASLGQMIGGIAHNMKTPIMSISGAAEGLTELVGEYIASINNPQVTPEDHKDIAKDMLEWITKIKTHTSYMSDIITAVKGQASQLATSDYSEFTVYDLYKKVDILIKHEIKKALLILEGNIECDPALTLHGDINNLIQVVINLISNSIQAYQGVPNQRILFNISADNKNVYIVVRDFGCGMNEETKNKLFKEMVTTKGKNGTGLGLYMSYSTIKAKFGGDISFTSEENVGTTFTITIPIK